MKTSAIGQGRLIAISIALLPYNQKTGQNIGNNAFQH